MTEPAQIIHRNFTAAQNQRQRAKLQEALSEIPPARSTDELERLVTIALQRSETIKERRNAATFDEPGHTMFSAVSEAEEQQPAS